MAEIDLVCWDFGDTLVDEQFMRIPPAGVSEWTAVYNAVLAERPEWVAQLDLGDVALHDLIGPLAERLPMSRLQIAAHLRAVWHQIEWFEDSRAMVERLDRVVAQAIVTVNPHEFHAIAMGCGLDTLVPTMVTSAETKTLSKVPMAERARELLGLAPGLTTTVLVDNKAHNVDEFITTGGHGILYERNANSLTALERLLHLDST